MYLLGSKILKATTMNSNQQQQGLMAIASAFAFWGIAVIFWKDLTGYNSIELTIHRLLWAFLILLVTIIIRGNLKVFLKAFLHWKWVKLHLLNGLLITVNWVAYVYAITHEQILQGSLAYFMVPILNTCMGFFVLKEQLNRLQWTAIALATIGVINEIWQFGQVPWLALLMAFSFAIYGMNKTRSPLDPISALAMETGLMLPLALGALIYYQRFGTSTIDLTQPHDWFWMASTGLITTIPLLLFAYGAKRIQLTTIGILQFLAPTIKFFLGVFLYGEAFPASKKITFALIWIALALYIYNLFSRQRETLPRRQ